MEKELGNHVNKKTGVKCIKCKWKKIALIQVSIISEAIPDKLISQVSLERIELQNKINTKYKYINIPNKSHIRLSGCN